MARQHAREPHRLRLRDVVADNLVRRLELHVDARLAPAAGPIEAVDVKSVRLDRVGRAGEVGEHLAHRGRRRLLGPLHHVGAGAGDRAVEILRRDAPDRIDQPVHQPGERVGGVGERDVAGRARLARGRRRLHRRHMGGRREGRDQRLGAHEHAEAVEVRAVERALAVALAEVEIAERLHEKLADRHAHRKRPPRLEEDGVALRRKQRVAVLAQHRFEVDPRALLPGRARSGRDGADETGERGGLSVRRSLRLRRLGALDQRKRRRIGAADAILGHAYRTGVHLGPQAFSIRRSSAASTWMLADRSEGCSPRCSAIRWNMPCGIATWWRNSVTPRCAQSGSSSVDVKGLLRPGVRRRIRRRPSSCRPKAACRRSSGSPRPPPGRPPAARRP